MDTKGMDELLKMLAIPTATGKTDHMYEYLRLLAIEKGWRTRNDSKWNLYVTKGEGTVEIYPCVVAHMDTVHRIEKGGIMPLVINGNIIGFNPEDMSLTGIGGDDKCGIWAAIHCLTVLPACKVVFFVDEERGCVGSGGCDLDFFKDCRYILQADRRGNADFVTDIFGRLSSDEFLQAVAPIIEQFGYKHSNGLMTDVKELRDRNVGISVANMSAGYYRPHFSGEFINIADLAHVCAMMQAICEQVTDVFPFERKIWVPEKDKKSQKGGGSNHNYDSIGRVSDAYVGLVRCDYCGTLTLMRELIDGSNGKPPFVCLDCALHKEEHGIYPASGLGGFWQRLQGKGGKRRKKRRKKRFNGFRGGGYNNGGNSNETGGIQPAQNKDEDVKLPF